MRNKLIYFFLLSLLSTTKAFAAPAGSACDWVDQEALAALGLANAVSKEASPDSGAQDITKCTIEVPNAPMPSLRVSVEPSPHDFVRKPFCDWQSQLTSVELGICSANVRDTLVTVVYLVPASSASGMESTFSDQIERLFNKYLETAAK